jgi:hypothetical protein
LEEKGEIITKSGKVWIEGGIIRSRVLIEGEYTLEHAMDDAQAFRKLAEKIEGKKLLLVEPKNILKVSSKTRKFQITEGPKIVDKMAQVVENPVTRIIVSFYIGINKMPIPIKIFKRVDEAVKWLKEM